MYHYELAGLPSIYLKNGYSIDSSPYGETVAIDDLEGLHGMIAISIIEGEKKLSQAEFKFLRSFLDMSQSVLADFLGVSDQMINRYETGKTAVTGSVDHMIRVLVQEKARGAGKVFDLIEKINELDRGIEQAEHDFCFSNDNQRWARTLNCVHG